MVRIRPYDLLDDLVARGVLDLGALERRIAEVEAELAALRRLRAVVFGEPPAEYPPRPTRTQQSAGRTVAQGEVLAAAPPKTRNPSQLAELELVARAQAGDHVAREQLVKQMLGGIRCLASKLAVRHGHVSMDDLIQEGAIAVLDVLTRYDPARGYRFSTFALPRIRGAMQDFLRANLNLTQGGGRRRREEYSHFSMLATLPAHSKFKERDYEALDNSAEELRDQAAALERFHDLLRGSSDTERAICVFYYRGDMNMRQIGEQLGLSESRISQLHSQLLERMRGAMALPGQPGEE